MRLSEFIRAHREQILSEWEAFARTLLPASQRLNIEELRDHAEGILLTIAADLETPQTKQQQAEKSKGRYHAARAQESEARAHGAVRAGTGFTLSQMVSEFRALRASVLRLWAEAAGEGNLNVEEMTRFNEAVDQALAESSRRFVEDLEHSKDLFLAILGHDLRNPLSAVMMSATQLMRHLGPECPQSKGVSRIMRSSIQMREIISDLLDFTRARLGSGMPIQRERLDLEELCNDTVEEVRALSPYTELQVETSGDLHGEWDGPRISQAMSNLLGNAVQHGAKNTPIRLEVRGEGPQVVLSVHNRGEPIPRGQLSEIFLPLKRVETARVGTSLGLGLFIAKEIIAAHGGMIEVESTEENGTTFTVHLPRSARRREVAAAEATH